MTSSLEGEERGAGVGRKMTCDDMMTQGGAQWAKSGGEAVLLQFSDFTKDPMHDFNRLFC